MTFEVKALKLIKHNKEVIFMKEVKQAIVLVDTYRRPSRKRNTVGRYIVSAKSAKAAVQLVQTAPRFGSVQFSSWEQHDSFKSIKYKEVKKMLYNSWKNKWILEEPHHACDRRN